MKYVLFNDAGELSGRFDSRVNHAIPSDAIELPEELWLSTIKETDGIWCLVDGTVVKRPLPVVPPDYGAIVAAERYKREAVGIEVDGLLIETTRDSQALIASTGLSAVLDPEYRCNFKTVTGFVEIGSAQILTIARAVRAHVQACFDRERALLLAIEAGDFRDEMLTEGWPDSVPPSVSDPSPTQPN
ncbi:hypothetical protein J2W43_004553 [Pseudomonas brassicacearum]|uniref:DUF4376 domain-containing protein n=1 Tax=Pseudomonas brassicacearum TaxID=930166 RepID=A0AAW8MGY1_9PSED|nr:DUF4376 domain-containing protein [Pseudomonas brassicacearum]MDR6960548.1 hypothetical protein [Pseudomonas brassicacearum]